MFLTSEKVSLNSPTKFVFIDFIYLIENKGAS